MGGNVRAEVDEEWEVGSESNALSGQISFCRQGDSLFRFSSAKAARIDKAPPLALLELAPLLLRRFLFVSS